MQATDCLTIHRQNTKIRHGVSVIAIRAVHRVVVANTSDRVSEETSTTVSNAYSVTVEGVGVSWALDLTNRLSGTVDSKGTECTESSAPFSGIVGVFRDSGAACLNAFVSI